MFNSSNTFHLRNCNQCCTNSTNADCAISVYPSLALCASLLPSALHPCSNLGETDGSPLPLLSSPFLHAQPELNLDLKADMNEVCRDATLASSKHEMLGLHCACGLGQLSSNVAGQWIGRGSFSVQELTIGFLLQHSPETLFMLIHLPPPLPSPPFSTPSLLIHSKRRQQQPSHACHELGFAMSSSFFFLQLYNWPIALIVAFFCFCTHSQAS